MNLSPSSCPDKMEEVKLHISSRESSRVICLQVLPSYLLAGLGMVTAGMLLDNVQVSDRLDVLLTGPKLSAPKITLKGKNMKVFELFYYIYLCVFGNWCSEKVLVRLFPNSLPWREMVITEIWLDNYSTWKQDKSIHACLHLCDSSCLFMVVNGLSFELLPVVGWGR